MSAVDVRGAHLRPRTVAAVAGGAVDPALARLGGCEPLVAVLRDPAVTDVLVNGSDGVWVDRGEGLVPVAVDLGGVAEVRELACRLAAAAGRRLDDASPAVDARLGRGLRLHAVLPPVAPAGPLLSLRVIRRRAFTLEELVSNGSVHPAMAGLMAALVSGGASFIVTGATGCGKTTMLSALLSLVEPTRRVVLVEEAGELSPAHPHVVRLEERPANVEGAGHVSLAQLVRHTLRMRPDVLVLGECRGAEVMDVLAAMNTGHQGAATLHVNTARDIPARLVALGAMAGQDRYAVEAQAAAGLDAAIHMRRTSQGRGVVEIAALVPDAAGRLGCLPALRVVGTSVEEGDGYAVLAARCGHQEGCEGAGAPRPRPCPAPARSR